MVSARAYANNLKMEYEGKIKEIELQRSAAEAAAANFQQTGRAGSHGGDIAEPMLVLPRSCGQGHGFIYINLHINTGLAIATSTCNLGHVSSTRNLGHNSREARGDGLHCQQL